MNGKSKKILIASIIISIAIIIASLSTLLLTKVHNSSSKIDAEILKSMNYTQITDEHSKVENTDFVQFSAFFTRDLDGDGNAEKLLGTCRDVNSTDELYMDLNVLTNGYLENGKITINSTNFNYSMCMIKDSVLKNNYISNNVKTIELNTVNAGTQKLIIGNVLANIGNDTNNYSKVSQITLTGTHVSDEGVRTDISKTIDLTVDWHGITKANISTSNKYYNYDSLNTETISFNFSLNELQNELLLKETESALTIPELNGYAPTEVKCTNDNIESNYNNETKVLTIKKNSKCNENGIITSKLSSYNTYTINVTYPKEAYEQISSYTILTIPITGYYTGYNNLDEEYFTNPYKSNIAKEKINIIFRETPKGEIYNFYVDFMDKKYVYTPSARYVLSKQYLLNLYDTEEIKEINNKEYIVRWRAVRGSEGEVPSIIMSETKEKEDNYGDKWNSTIMHEYVANTGIYFENANEFLEENGTISVYNNDTNELIHTFTKEEWNNYTRNNPYKYEEPVKHIRVETSKTNLNTSLSVYNIKELDVNKVLQDFTKQDIKDIDLVYTYLTGICNIEGQDSGTRNDMDCIHYVSEKSNSRITLGTTKISTQETLNNEKIYIDAIYNQEGDSKWQNGEFLVEVPEEIINMKINNVTTNNKNVKIVAYDLFKKDRKYFIKIITENENPENYKITIDCNLTPDPRISTTNKYFVLYGYNQYCNEYYYETKDIYDVNSNNNIEEQVAKSTINANFLSPTELITLETISNYNETDEITIAPNVAEVERDTKQATINIALTNNYQNTVSGIQILGKIPFVGNTFVLNSNVLGSEFTTTMKEQGIRVADELKEKVVVYYSENENPNKNIDDSKNGWMLKEDIPDFSKIKTYLIDITQDTMQVGKSYTFNYIVNIPGNVNYNLTSYSNHVVYYELNTEGGKLQLNTEPNKVGIRVTRKYKLELTKSKSDFETLKIPGATYKIEYTDIEGNEKTRILTTDSNGNINMDGLYIGITYKITEIKSPENYALNNETIEFAVVEDEQGKLKVETTNEGKVTINEQEEKVLIKTEDEPKYNITITKIDKHTGESIDNVSFRVNGKIYKTNRDGQITIKKLSQNIEYTLIEEEAEGYYLLNKITFKLIKDNEGNLKIESNNEAFYNAIIQDTDGEDLIQISNISIINEKIPTYNLQILKVEENEKENDISKLKKLEGARFKLKSVDSNKVEQYYTDNNGIINIPNLYKYVEGKSITGRYILQELEAPEGYANSLEEIKFKVTNSDKDKLKIEIENQTDLQTIKDIQIDENTIKIIIQNVPLFKLTKTDLETGEPLAGAKFVIYELDKNGNELDFAKDVNGNYIGNINEENKYVVTTEESGMVVLPLKPGMYKTVEIGYPEGYLEEVNEQYFKITGSEVPEAGVIEINNIEDLVQLSNNVNAGDDYKDKTVKLMRPLDFEDIYSYNNPEDTSYGDINRDGNIEGIMQELTDKVDGQGFTPIGDNGKSFSGTFDGQGYEIRNLYINHMREFGAMAYIGLFGRITNANIKNLGVTGDITEGKGHYYQMVYIGGVVGEGIDSKIDNCYNLGNVSFNDNSGAVAIGGIAGYCSDINKCYNTGDICSDAGNSMVGGIVGELGHSIYNCYNIGNVSSNSNISYAGGIIGKCGFNAIKYCYNIGDVSAGLNGTLNYAGGITGYFAGGFDMIEAYYLDKINITGNHIIGLGEAVTESYMLSKDFYDVLNKDEAWLFKENSYPKLNMNVLIDDGIVKETMNLNIKNTIKKYNITTEIAENSESERTGGTITGEYKNGYSIRNNIKFVETIKHGHDSVEEITIKSDDRYLIYKITINGEEINFATDEQGNYKIPKGYFKNVEQDYHIVVTFEKSDRVLIINKVDEVTNNPIKGTKFAIYSITETYETIDFIKNYDGEYIGEKNSSGIYVISTDENGIIKLSLEPGLYKAVEIESAEGYILEEREDLRTTYYKVETSQADLGIEEDNDKTNNIEINNTDINKADVVINNIEDLVKLSNSVNSGTTYEGKTIVLARTLDFNEDEFYNDPEDRSFGDYNGDGTEEGIKAELTNTLGNRI